MSKSPWPAVFAVGILLTVSFGTVLYGFSIYVTDSSAGADFSTSMLSFAYTGAVIVSGLIAAPLGRWMDQHGTKRVAAVGGVVTCAGLVGFSFASSPLVLIAAWWLLIGPGTAMTYYEPAFVVINQTVTPGSRPKALGVVTVIGGFAGAVFLPLVEAMNSSLGWRLTVRSLGLAIAVLGVAAAFLIPNRVRAHAEAATRDHLPLGLIMRDKRFTYLTTGLVLTGIAATGMLAHRVDRFTEAGSAIGTVAVLAGLASLVSLPGRFLGPLIGGRSHGAAVLQWFALVLALATALTIPAGPKWFMPAHFFIYGMAFGAILPLRALAMDQWYGQNHYGRRMGIQQTATLMIGGLGPLAVGVMRDVTGSWISPMTLLTVAAAAGFLFIAMAQRASMALPTTSPR